MHSVVQAYDDITHKERHKCSLASELYSWRHIEIVWQRDTTNVLK